MSNKKDDFDITDDMLRESIPIATKIIIDDLLSDDELNHVFSKGFERKMKKLIKQQKRSSLTNKIIFYSKQTAIVFLIVLASLLTNELATYFKYPQEIRTLIYTTNSMESYNRLLRKVTKSKSIFPLDDSLHKSLYLATMDISERWTQKIRNWTQILAHLSIYFEERILTLN
ncbi:transposase mutator type [Clostridioides difficile]|nr:transposase mutator type [Clostridioides difficile]